MDRAVSSRSPIEAAGRADPISLGHIGRRYDKLSVGGYAIIDDYAEDAWTHCRRAVDEFRRERGIDEPMIQVDSKCFYWKRDH
jgi:hypothetical protein